MKTAALYIRKSTKDKQQNSLLVQTQNMQRYCEGHYTIVETFQDEQSGRSVERIGLLAAIQWLSKDADRVLVFYKVDRYARTINEFERIRPFIESGQIKFMDIGMPNDQHDMMMIQMKLVFAENESRLLGQRVSATIKHIEQTTGKKWGLSDSDMHKGRLASAEVRMTNADTYGRHILNAINLIKATNGRRTTQADLVRVLNGLGILTPKGKDWSQPSLCRTLKRLERRGINL